MPTGFVLIALNRLADGLDGAVARAIAATTEAAIWTSRSISPSILRPDPTRFAVADPERNALAAGRGLGELLSERRGLPRLRGPRRKARLSTKAQGAKSISLFAGLAEGGETVAVFLAWCCISAWFAPLAYAMAALTGISAAFRIIGGERLLREPRLGSGHWPARVRMTRPSSDEPARARHFKGGRTSYLLDRFARAAIGPISRGDLS